MKSYVVKLIPTAIGPLIQFMLSPLYNPVVSPSFCNTDLTVLNMVLYSGFLDPWVPSVCMRLRTMSSGYVVD